MRLQKVPRAFLDALDLRTDGVNPPQFGDAVVGTFEMDAHYLADRLASASATGNLLLNGSAVSLQVAAGQWWRVVALSGVVDIPGAANEFAKIALAIQLAGVAVPTYVGQMQTEGTGLGAADHAQVTTWVPPFPVLLPPATSMQVRASRTFGANRTATVSCLYVPLTA